MESVKIIVEFSVPVQELWKAWTTPYVIRKWFGSDPGGTVIEAFIHAVPQGKYEITFADFDGTRHTCFGTFTEVKQYEFLSFSWEWKSEPGHVSHVRIRFTQNETKSAMEFEHSNLNPDSLHGYAAGWGSTFEKLRRVISNQ